jgi:hypothetical protein
MFKFAMIVCVFVLAGCSTIQVVKPETKGSISIERDLESNKTKAIAKIEFKL